LLGSAALAACRHSVRDRDGRVRLRLWYSLGGRNREVLLEIVRRFHAANDDVRVEAVHQGEYFESLAKLRTAIAAKSAPGLSHFAAGFVPYLERATVLEPLDDSFAKIPFVAALAQAGAFRKPPPRTYAVPLNRSTPLMYCNGELFSRAGLRPPATWEELVGT